MARTAIIQGPVGSGKTTSLRHLPVEQSALIAPNDKALPWRGSRTWEKRRVPIIRIEEIAGKLRQIDKVKSVKYAIIEDFLHFQHSRVYSDAFAAAGSSKNPYQRWEQLARDTYQAIFAVAKELRSDLWVILIGHTEINPDGVKVFRSLGKAVGNTIEPTSYADLVFHAAAFPDRKVAEERYMLITHHDGVHEARSPIGMFEEDYVPNDLYPLLQQAEAYYTAEGGADDTAQKTNENQD